MCVLCIIYKENFGLGLIGGSIAKSLNKTEFNVFGMDTNSQTIEKAISEKVIAQKCNHIDAL